MARIFFEFFEVRGAREGHLSRRGVVKRQPVARKQRGNCFPYLEGSGVSIELRPTDAELLQRFIGARDEDAFHEIVKRHGQLVMGVCLQLLKHRQDAEDAFQASFLILASRARSIESRSCLASWLYRVAFRTALRASKRRRNSMTLDDHEPSSDEDSLQLIYHTSLRQALYEELQALPESYRTPIILCYLEQKTRAEAADELESTEPSIKARLARGKRMLRLRLAKRGVGLSVALTVVLKHQADAVAAITPTLMSLTVSNAAQPTRLHVDDGPNAVELIKLVKEGSQAIMIASTTKTLCVTSIGAVMIGISVLGIAVAAQNDPIGPSVGHRNREGTRAPSATTLVRTAVRNEGSEDFSPVQIDRQQPTPRRPAPAQQFQSNVPLDRSYPPTSDSSREVVRASEITYQPEPTQSPMTATWDLERSKFAADRLSAEADFLDAKATALAMMANSARLKAKQAESSADRLAYEAEAHLKQAEANHAKRSADICRKEVSSLTKPQPTAQGRSYRDPNSYRPPTPTAPPSYPSPAPYQSVTPIPNILSPNQQTHQAPTAPRSPGAPYARSVPRFRPDPPPQADRSPEVHTPYRIQVGDTLDIAIAGSNEGDDRKVLVEPTGLIPLGPRMGRIKVAGMTVAEAEEALAKHMAKYFNDPAVQIVVDQRAERPRDFTRYPTRNPYLPSPSYSNTPRSPSEPSAPNSPPTPPSTAPVREEDTVRPSTQSTPTDPRPRDELPRHDEPTQQDGPSQP